MLEPSDSGRPIEKLATPLCDPACGYSAEHSLREFSVQTPALLRGVRYTSLRDRWTSNRSEAMDSLDRYLVEMNGVFADPNEVGPHEIYVRNMDRDPSYDIKIAICEGRTAGGIHTWMLDAGQAGTVCAIALAWTARDQQGKKIGSTLNALAEEEARQAGGWAMVAEVNDHCVMRRSEVEKDLAGGTSPEGREIFWGKQGFRKLDMTYIQPALVPGAYPVTYTAFVMHTLREGPPGVLRTVQENGSSGIQIKRPFALEMIRAYMRKMSSHPELETDPSLRAVLADAQLGPEWIDLIDMTAMRRNLGPVFKSYRFHYLRHPPA